jgi:5-formyltetrahydrofolate cyclo-ligase
LGQGGGYYDATLADLRAKKPILAVGMAYAQQAVLFNLPLEDHDQRLDWVITPQAAYFYGDL